MGASVLNKDAMCLVVFRVPTISGVFAPAASATRFDMELDRTSDGCKWHSVIVEWAVVIGIC